MALEKPTGNFAVAPDDAPREIAQPLSADTLADQLARAQQNERPLAPFNPQPTHFPRPTSPEQATLVDAASRALEQSRQTSASTDLNAAAKALSEARAVRQAGSTQPAASDSDSPSRGIPQPILDPGKAITGGFGPAAEAQYYAINGLELQEIVRGMVDQLIARISTDLRFSMALTYPKMVCELTLAFHGWAQDKTETVKVVRVDERTPEEVARQFADEVVFVVRETKREFTEAGEPLDPPDRMRDAAGLPKPGKQLIQTGAGRMIIDVPTLPDGTF